MYGIAHPDATRHPDADKQKGRSWVAAVGLSRSYELLQKMPDVYKEHCRLGRLCGALSESESRSLPKMTYVKQLRGCNRSLGSVTPFTTTRELTSSGMNDEI